MTEFRMKIESLREKQIFLFFLRHHVTGAKQVEDDQAEVRSRWPKSEA